MQRWITSLTLVAYLIGGWALPTIHHHGGGLAAGTPGEHGCHAHGHEALLAEPHSPATCSHSCHATEQVDEADSNTMPDSGFAYRASNVDACQGLCALCVARSLCSQRLSEATVATGTTLVGKSFIAKPVYALQRARGSLSPRGPPLFV